MKPGLCAAYKAEIPLGKHSEHDVYMLALYTTGGHLDEFLQAYTTKGEAAGQGYKPGGQRLMGFRVEQDGTAACITFDDCTWTQVTLRDVSGAVVYNASKGNRAVGVVALAEKTSSTNGPFTVYFPEATATEAVFVID